MTYIVKNIFNLIEGEEGILQLPEKKIIALVAHDNRKKDLLSWVEFNRNTLVGHRLVGTGTTGKLIEEKTGLFVEAYQSGPLGGDQQIGAEMSYNRIHVLIFFWDPLSAQPHDPDVKALLRLSVLYNVPTACNRATADYIISSELFHHKYDRILINYPKRRPAIKEEVSP